MSGPHVGSTSGAGGHSVAGQTDSGWAATGQHYPQPELWLHPGPPMPQRSWQRRTRLPVIIVTAVACLVFATIGILAVGRGLFGPTYFTATGALAADCQTEQARIGGTTVDLGTPVRILDQSGGEVGVGSFDTFSRGDVMASGPEQCALIFTIDETRAGASGEFLVIVGDDLYRQQASGHTLQVGVRLRP